jgi:putative tricarboxylic transport membrane protein
MFEAMASAASRLMDPAALAMLFSGAAMGATFGALPGLGGIVALAIALPFTFGMDPMLAMFFFAGIMSSVTFGGSVPAILLNTPGTPQNAATCFDGYAMTQRGEGGRALAVSAASCFFGSIGGALVTVALLPLMRPIIFSFDAPEFFWLVVCGLVMIAFAAKGNMVKGLAGGGIGLLISFIGYDDMYGVFRYTLGSDYLWDGVPLVPFVVGVFAVSELINYSARGGTTMGKRVDMSKIDWRRQTLQGVMDVVKRPIQTMRASAIGAGIGIIPGLGGGVAAFMSYAVGMHRTSSPETYGKGNVEGIIASEAANDAKDGGALLPTITFGIPGSPDMAILLGAFVLHGLQPGPELLRDNLDLVYALLFGIVISQIATSGLGLMASPWLARISLLKSRWIAPFVLLMVFVGTYMVRVNIFDVAMAIGAGLFGFVMRRFGFPLITVVIGYILGPLVERSFLQSLQISDGSYLIFVTRPIAVGLMIATILVLLLPLITKLRQRRYDLGASGNKAVAAPLWFIGDLAWTMFLALGVAVFLVGALSFPDRVQILPLLTGSGTLLLLLGLVASTLLPRLKHWRGSAPQEDSGNDADTPATGPDEPPWPVVLRFAVYIMGFFAAVFMFGFFLVPPFVVALFLIYEADVPRRWAILSAVIASFSLYAGMVLLNVDMWTGALPEIVPGLIGGSIIPPI